MKLSQAFAKLTFGKAKLMTTLGALAVAGAAMTVATPAAKAQVAFGVEVGRAGYYAPAPAPVYAAPAYGYGYGYGNGYDRHEYWEHRRAEEWRAQQWREHEYFEHHRDFGRDRRYDDGRRWR